MSISNLFLIAICFGVYRLGAYNERFPGDMWQRFRSAALWTWKLLGQ